jgi:hypothetical protein
MKPIPAYLVAAAAAFVVIVVVTALWIVHLRLGPRLDGWVAGPMVLFVPMFLLILTGCWLIARPVLGRWIDWRLGTVAAATLIGVYLLTAVICGPIACFQPGPNRAMGWFIVIGVAAAALMHHLLWTRLRRNGGQR